MLLFLSFLFLLWTVLGSFSSVIIHRLRSPNCETTLWARDLVPIFSYMFSQGRCRHCDKKISIYYPALELSLWIFFAVIGYFLSDYSLIFKGDIIEMTLLDFWLFVWFFAFIYTVYDILYLEIPESILLILVVGIFCALTVQSFFPDLYNTGLHQQIADVSSVSIWISVLSWWAILWALYYIMLAGLDEKYDILIFLWVIMSLLGVKYWLWVTLSEYPIYSGIIWTLCIFGFFFFQILVSKGKWMWAWDLRIAIVLGLLLWSQFWYAWLMISYIAGSFLGLSEQIHVFISRYFLL